jgi:hypothetical protein
MLYEMWWVSSRAAVLSRRDNQTPMVFLWVQCYRDFLTPSRVEFRECKRGNNPVMLMSLLVLLVL